MSASSTPAEPVVLVTKPAGAGKAAVADECAAPGWGLRFICSWTTSVTK